MIGKDRRCMVTINRHDDFDFYSITIFYDRSIYKLFSVPMAAYVFLNETESTGTLSVGSAHIHKATLVDMRGQ